MNKIKKIVIPVLLLSLLTGMIGCTQKTEGGAVGTEVVEERDVIPYADGLHRNNVKKTDVPFVVDGKSDYVVVSGEMENSVAAADMLRGHVKNKTGYYLPSISADEVTWNEDDKYIIVGSPSLFEQAGLQEPEEDLGATGHYIVSKGNSVFIYCESKWALPAAVFTFLHYTIGYVMYAEDMVVYEKDGTMMPEFDVMNRPDFEYHIPGNMTNSVRRTEGMGYYPGVSFIPVGGKLWHNSLDYLPPDQWNETHPEWYSGTGQLCYTAHGNAEELKLMQDEVVKVLIERVEAHPDLDAITITQEDLAAWCTCKACSESKQKYGAESASVIQFTNAVSARLNDYLKEKAEKNHTKPREVMVLFFAYRETYKPPVKLEDGVYVPVDESVVCNKYTGALIAASDILFTKSIYDEDNEAALRSLENWGVIAQKTYWWMYTTNFNHYMFPYCNFETLVELFQCCKRNGGNYMFPQGQHNNGPGTGFNVFKEYVISRALWDVNLDYNELEDDFFEHYFGPAAEPMQEFFIQVNLQSRWIQDTYPSDVSGWMYDNLSQAKFWPKKTLDGWMELIEEARSAIAPLKHTDITMYQILENHITLESLFPRYALVTLYDSFYSETELNEMRQEIKADCTALNITNHNEATSMETVYQSWGLSK